MTAHGGTGLGAVVGFDRDQHRLVLSDRRVPQIGRIEVMLELQKQRTGALIP